MSAVAERKRWLVGLGVAGLVTLAVAQGAQPVREIIAGAGLLGGGTGPSVTLAVDTNSLPPGPPGPEGPEGPQGPVGSIADTSITDVSVTGIHVQGQQVATTPITVTKRSLIRVDLHTLIYSPNAGADGVSLVELNCHLFKGEDSVKGVLVRESVSSSFDETVYAAISYIGDPGTYSFRFLADNFEGPVGLSGKATFTVIPLE